MKFMLVEVTDGGADFNEFEAKDVETWAQGIDCKFDDRADGLRRFVQNARLGDTFTYGNGMCFAIRSARARGG